MVIAKGREIDVARTGHAKTVAEEVHGIDARSRCGSRIKWIDTDDLRVDSARLEIGADRMPDENDAVVRVRGGIGFELPGLIPAANLHDRTMTLCRCADLLHRA